MAAQARRRGLLAGVLMLLAGPAPAEINEGTPRFLTAPPEAPPHHHTKHIVIDADSLASGWIRSEQCHYNLDRVGAMEVVFGKDSVRGLEILRSRNIGRAWVEGASVQMENVGADAHICIGAENRVLTHDAKRNTYTLSTGPYMRRFLDGYFPMRVNLEVEYPPGLLQLQGVAPAELEPRMTAVPGQVEIAAVFEGKLMIGLHFSAVPVHTP